MGKTMLIAALLAAASFNPASAAEVVPMKRTALPAISFDELLKKIAWEVTFCNRLHGTMTKITSATMRGTTLVIGGDANAVPIDSYPMKVAPTPEQLKSLKGQPICDAN